MACLACRREHRGNVVGILGRRVVLHVAIRAVRVRTAEVPADMTVCTLKLGVRAG